MPEKKPIIATTFGYVAVALGLALVAGLLIKPVGGLFQVWLIRRFGTEQRFVAPEQSHTTALAKNNASPEGDKAKPVGKSRAVPQKDRSTIVGVTPDDSKDASLALEYDSLKQRYSAVDESLKQRASDLGSIPLKPKIVATLETTKVDLAAAKAALHERNWAAATQRMERVKKSLIYLESL